MLSYKIQIYPISGKTRSLVAVGDIAFSGLPDSSVRQIAQGCLYSEDISAFLSENEFSYANLECPLTNRREPILKSGPNLAAPPEAIEILKRADFDAAILANNHILDHGVAALQDTLKICKDANIKTFGVGNNLLQASEPLFVDVKGQVVAFFAFAEEEFTCAGEDIPGAAKFDLTLASRLIHSTKEKADLVIVNVHGGNELYPIPSPRVQNSYRFLIESGADAVIGYHPHTIQGIEIYNNAPIVYSLGNFFFPSKTKRSECRYKGLTVKLIIANNRISALEVMPCRQVVSDDKVTIETFSEDEYAHFVKKFERLGQIASDTTLVKEFWKCFCAYKRVDYLNALKTSASSLPGEWSFLIRKIFKSRDIRYLSIVFNDLMHCLFQRKDTRNRQLAKLRNLFICPAHKDLLASILEYERLGIKPQKDIWDEFEDLIFDCHNG